MSERNPGKRKPDPSAELGILHYALQQVRSREIAVDGGAYLGYWARELARKFRTVYAFEPDADNFKGMVDLNTAARRQNPKLGTIVPTCAALGDRNGAAFLSHHPKRESATAGYVQATAQGAGSVPVQVRTIDSLLLPSCGLVKLDLEGGELYALHGARHTLVTARPVLVLELGGLSARNYGVPESRITDLLDELGYALFVAQHPNRVYVPC